MAYPKQFEIEVLLLKTLVELGGPGKLKDDYPKVTKHLPRLTEGERAARSRPLMKLQTLFVVTAALTFGAAAQNTVDPFMGDWEGSVSRNGPKQSVSVYMIPLGKGRYEARFVADFQERGPCLFRLRGVIRDGQFRFVDDIPFDVGRITDTTDKGVVLAASLWSGELADNSVQGSLAGREVGHFELRKTQRVSPDLGKRPPAGAVVLFDGSNFDQWQSGNPGQTVAWKLLPDAVMEVAKGGNIVSKEKFDDHQIHLEFRLPYMPDSFGQKRANSGVYVQGRYELQVLDSYGLEGFDNECGGVYQICPPLVNMCAPPLQWQSYDITFHSAKRGDDGKKSANARITVVHNGVVIHDNYELPRTTPGGVNEKEGEPEGLLLQDHGDPVQYRNIWVKRL